MAEDGRPVCISTIRDMTREVEAEQALKLNEKQFRIAAMQFSNIIIQFDLESRIGWVTGEDAARFGVRGVCKNLPDSTELEGIVAPESVAEHRRIYQEMRG